jgi:hypothetical protein
MLRKERLKELRETLCRERIEHSLRVEYWAYDMESLMYKVPYHVLHHNHGPAYIRYDSFGNVSFKTYQIHGFYHNEHGPAMVGLDRGVYVEKYFLLGEQVDKELFESPGFIASVVD